MGKKAVILGGGPIDSASVRLSLGEISIACDRGYRYFSSVGKEPDVFVGDFDTLPEKELGHPKMVLRLNPVKDDTDLGYALKWALSEGYDTFWIYGGLGGRIDQTVANLQLLSFLKERGAEGFLVTPDGEDVLFVRKAGERLSLRPEGKTRFSLFALSEEATVSESGVFYPLDKATLSRRYPLGVSNELLEGKEGRVSVTEGEVLLEVPLSALRKE